MRPVPYSRLSMRSTRRVHAFCGRISRDLLVDPTSATACGNHPAGLMEEETIRAVRKNRSSPADTMGKGPGEESGLESVEHRQPGCAACSRGEPLGLRRNALWGQKTVSSIFSDSPNWPAMLEQSRQVREFAYLVRNLIEQLPASISRKPDASHTVSQTEDQVPSSFGQER